MWNEQRGNHQVTSTTMLVLNFVFVFVINILCKPLSLVSGSSTTILFWFDTHSTLRWPHAPYYFTLEHNQSSLSWGGISLQGGVHNIKPFHGNTKTAITRWELHCAWVTILYIQQAWTANGCLDSVTGCPWRGKNNQRAGKREEMKRKNNEGTRNVISPYTWSGNILW